MQRALAAELMKIGGGNFSNDTAADATMALIEMGVTKVEDLDEMCAGAFVKEKALTQMLLLEAVTKATEDGRKGEASTKRKAAVPTIQARIEKKFGKTKTLEAEQKAKGPRLAITEFAERREFVLRILVPLCPPVKY